MATTAQSPSNNPTTSDEQTISAAQQAQAYLERLIKASEGINGSITRLLARAGSQAVNNKEDAPSLKKD